MAFRQSERGSTAVLIVDECHNLEWDVLEEIRMLGNLENRHGKLLQVILAGQPEFDRKLDAPEPSAIEAEDRAPLRAEAF